MFESVCGAAFETRQSRNTYSIVHLDLLHGKRSTTTIHYQPSNGTFGAESTDDYPIEISPAGTCGIEELARAITAYKTSFSAFAHYLAALLLDQKTELPIGGTKGFVFGSLAVLRDQPESPLKRATIQFLPLRNVLRVHYRRLPLTDILNQFGDALTQYGAALKEASESNGELRARLAALDRDACSIAASPLTSDFSHTTALLQEISDEHNWTELRKQAARHVGVGDSELAQKATRFLALALSHSSDSRDKEQSVSLYKTAVARKFAGGSDYAVLAALLNDMGHQGEAKRLVLTAITEFPDQNVEFWEIGQKIVEATGDREFRDQLDDAMKARSR